jgi:hypothetical protein
VYLDAPPQTVRELAEARFRGEPEVLADFYADPPRAAFFRNVVEIGDEQLRALRNTDVHFVVLPTGRPAGGAGAAAEAPARAAAAAAFGGAGADAAVGAGAAAAAAAPSRGAWKERVAATEAGVLEAMQALLKTHYEMFGAVRAWVKLVEDARAEVKRKNRVFFRKYRKMTKPPACWRVPVDEFRELREEYTRLMTLTVPPCPCKHQITGDRAYRTKDSSSDEEEESSEEEEWIEKSDGAGHRWYERAETPEVPRDGRITCRWCKAYDSPKRERAEVTIKIHEVRDARDHLREVANRYCEVLRGFRTFFPSAPLFLGAPADANPPTLERVEKPDSDDEQDD